MTMILSLMSCLGLFSGLAFQSPTATPPLSDPLLKYIYPVAKAIPAPEVEIDVSEAPDLKSWADQAKKLVIDWFPHVSQLLATDQYTPPKTIKLIFKQGISNPAFTSRNDITISASWVQKHPDDFGMVIHEMVHVLQRYPGGGNKPGWLVEGIADYIRWWRYEPESPRTRIDPEKASYRDSYRTTGAFIAWIVGRVDRNIVRQLDSALRSRNYTDELFKTVTGKALDELWGSFVGSIKQR